MHSNKPVEKTLNQDGDQEADLILKAKKNSNKISKQEKNKGGAESRRPPDSKVSMSCFEHIADSEGLSLEAYQCPAGVWTIGYGHTLGVKQGDKITKDKAESLLWSDILTAEMAVNRLVKRPLTPGQFDAMVSFTFNLGTGNLEKSTLLRMVNLGRTDKAALEFLRWDKARDESGQLVPLAGLRKRRKAESEMFAS
jgi:lysozyme